MRSDHQRMYKGKLWRELRRVQLAREPLCAACAKRGHYVTATVVNHIKAHKGNWSLFKDITNLQSLCKSCHDGEAQHIDIHGYSDRIGDDGWPSDSNHPFNKNNNISDINVTYGGKKV